MNKFKFIVLQIVLLCSVAAAQLTFIPNGTTAFSGSSGLTFIPLEDPILFRYAAGDSLATATYSRAAPDASYITSGGLVAFATTNVARDSHYIGGNRTLLLEGSRTNAMLRSQEFGNAAWTVNEATISSDATTAPDGTTTADKIVETATTPAGNGHGVYQTPAGGTISSAQSASIYLKAGERTWAFIRVKAGITTPYTYVNLATGVFGTMGSGVTGRITSLPNSWYRVEVTATIESAGLDFNVGPATADLTKDYLGDITKGIYAWGAQFEVDAAVPSSYIPTVAATVTRAADSLSFPVNLTGRAVSVYVRRINTFAAASNPSARVVKLGPANDAFSNLLMLDSYTSAERAYYDASGGTSFPNVASTAAAGDIIETIGRVSADGTPTVLLSINQAAATSATGVASGLPASWSTLTVGSNYTGVESAFSAFLNIIVAEGERDHAWFRSRIP